MKILITVGLVTIFLTYYFCVLYRNIALSKGIIASLNYRTLHQHEIPKGGGIIISVAFLSIYLLSYFLGLVKEDQTLLVCIGGLCISIFGFIDDIKNIKPIIKFMGQFLFAFIIIFIAIPVNQYSFTLFNISLFFLISFLIVWVMNTINFMDGIDGLAGSISLVIFWSIFIIPLFLGLESIAFLNAYLLGCCCLGFLIINLSKNKLFMGDSGSLFFGYFISYFMVKTIADGLISPWFWGIMMAYALTETIATTSYRILFKKKWYSAHRSHAYQNIARVINNHLYVTGVIFLYHIFWLLPLSLMSVYDPMRAWLYFLLATFPVLAFNLLYGPRFSNH